MGIVNRKVGEGRRIGGIGKIYQKEIYLLHSIIIVKEYFIETNSH